MKSLFQWKNNHLPRWPVPCLFAFLTLFSGGAPASASPRPALQSTKSPGPSQWFARGQAALKSGDLATAEAAFREVLKLDPQAAPAYVNLGVVAMRRKQWDQALALLNRAEHMDPGSPGIRLNIGLVQFRRGKYSAAIPHFASVVRDQPASAQARYLLGLCQVLTEKFAEAVNTLEPLWSINAGDVGYLYVYDIAANKSGQKQLDNRILEQMLKVGTDTPEFHLILGKAYLNRQEVPQAIEELNRAAGKKDDLAYVHFELGLAYMMQGNMQEAESEFLRERAVDPDLPDTYEQLGIVYSRTQRPDRARESLLKSIEMDAGRPGPHMELARSYFSDNKDKEALREVDAALRLDPDVRGGNLLKGRVLQRLGRPHEAAAEFAKAKKSLGEGLEKEREKLANQSVADPALKQQPEPQP
jgi:tetratricopeptide (TPR) repeat protein